MPSRCTQRCSCVVVVVDLAGEEEPLISSQAAVWLRESDPAQAIGAPRKDVDAIVADWLSAHMCGDACALQSGWQSTPPAHWVEAVFKPPFAMSKFDPVFRRPPHILGAGVLVQSQEDTDHRLVAQPAFPGTPHGRTPEQLEIAIAQAVLKLQDQAGVATERRTQRQPAVVILWPPESVANATANRKAIDLEVGGTAVAAGDSACHLSAVADLPDVILVERTEPTQACEDAAQPDLHPVHVISRLRKACHGERMQSIPNTEPWTLDATPRADKDKQKNISMHGHANADRG